MMLALVGIPAMLKRGYSKPLATGSVCAGGTLGILIPPSIMLVVYGPMANIGVGKLFFGAFLPGFLLSGLYITYILVWCLLKPSEGPPVSAEERNVSLSQKSLLLLKSLVPPLAIILAVLGSIFFGIAAPTEAGAVGALAACLLAVAYRSFSFKALRETALATIKLSGMILLIASLSFAFVGVFIRAQCGGVRGLAAAMASAADETTDIAATVLQGNGHFGGHAEFPYSEIMRAVVHYEPRKRRP
jgi:tripartite ATP-independent transporter DctM subunit